MRLDLSLFGIRAAQWFVALALLLLPGCKSREDSILSSDANGYLCPQCGEKFFTAGSVFAEKCPKCGSANIEDVVGYVCPADQSVILVGKGSKGAPCPKCGKYTNEKKLPTADELKQWGARKA